MTTTPMHSEKTVYWLDGKRHAILDVNGPRDQFALDNDGIWVKADDVRGKPIWDFITGDTTRMWFDALLQFVSIRSIPIERPYRCDSPHLKRLMQMTIIPENSGILRIEHRLVSTEQRQVPIFIQRVSRDPLESYHSRCSVCGQIKKDQCWEEPDREATSDVITLKVSYVVCQDCSLPSKTHRLFSKANAPLARARDFLNPLWICAAHASTGSTRTAPRTEA